MKSKRLTSYEFFAGGGMARLGLGQGWSCAFANEWCEKKATAYRAFFGGTELRVCDVADLTADDLPGSPTLVGFFPVPRSVARWLATWIVRFPKWNVLGILAHHA